MAGRTAIVCLANSRKLGHYCVAGVEIGSSAWIRPIGSGDHGAITLAEQLLDDGTQPALLDVIEVPLGSPVPQPGQPENWTLAQGAWTRVRGLADDEARGVLGGLEVTTPVFGTQERSISVEDVRSGAVSSSLAVIRPEELSWRKEVWPERTKIRAVFRHAGAWHDLPVTDPAWCSQFVEDPAGSYGHSDEEDVFLVVSLGEPLNDQHWKLVAGVIGIGR